MPTYVYKFVDTNETIEVYQAFTDEALTEAVHPGTGTTLKVKKVFTPVGVTFKGGGFYKTDSRNGKKAKSTNGDGGGSSNDSSDAGSSKDTGSTDGAKTDVASSNGATKDAGSTGAGSKPAKDAAPAAPAPARSGSGTSTSTS